MLAAVAFYAMQVIAGVLVFAVAMRMLRAALLAILSEAERLLRPLLAAAASSARTDAERVLYDDLGAMTRLLPPLPHEGLPRLGSELRLALLAAAASAERGYREAAAAGSADEAQDLLDELAAAGLTGIIDRGGRAWEITVYVRMAARTAIERLHIALQTRALQQAGIVLVKVVRYWPGPPCPKCAPWIGQTLTLSPLDLRYPTLAVAMAAGLLHPNCRDSIIPAGNDVPQPTAEQAAAEAARYAAEQAANARVAAWRRAQRIAAVAITAKAKARARALAQMLRRYLGGA